jgi:hypothetical protein
MDDASNLAMSKARRYQGEMFNYVAGYDGMRASLGQYELLMKRTDWIKR